MRRSRFTLVPQLVLAVAAASAFMLGAQCSSNTNNSPAEVATTLQMNRQPATDAVDGPADNASAEERELTETPVVGEPEEGDDGVVENTNIKAAINIDEEEVHGYERAEQATETAAATGPVIHVEMVARQFEFEPSTVTVEQGTRVQLTLTTEDVAHGLALPEFGVSERIEPGETVEVEFIADKAGTYIYFCNVYCGTGHGNMKGRFIVTDE